MFETKGKYTLQVIRNPADNHRNAPMPQLLAQEKELLEKRNIRNNLTSRYVLCVSFCALILFVVVTFQSIWTLEYQQLEQDQALQYKRRTRIPSYNQVNSRSRTQAPLSAVPSQRHTYESCVQNLHALIESEGTGDNSTHASKYFKARKSGKQQILPEFNTEPNEAGGVIVFWHLAKTGGTTVRKQCATVPGVDYMMLIKPQDFYGGARRSADRLIPPSAATTHKEYKEEPMTVDKYNHSKSHTLFVELHGMGAPTVLEMEEHLRTWRELSQQYGTPLFVFTLLREPVAYSFSFFNFFNQHATHQPTAFDLVRSSFSRQCHDLIAPSKGGHATTASCGKLYHKLFQWFDWVGTTESMSSHTLPLLKHLLRHKDAQARFATNATSSWLLPTNNSNKKYYNVASDNNNEFALSRDNLSVDQLEQIRRRTCLDRALWERAQQDFTMDMWQNDIAVAGAGA